MSIGKKIILMFVALILTTVLAVGIYVTTAYHYSTSELSKTYKEFRTGDQVSQAIEQTEPFTILLMGVDTGSNDRKEKWVGNSDSMILVTVNPKTKQTTVTSLERDILIKLSGDKDNEMTGVEAKLNAAYASGGAEMAIATVQDLLNIKIDKYMMINMEGLIQLVEAVGGITVTNHFDYPIKISDWEPEFQATIEPGTHKINGEQALVYARMRYDDPEGDYGRQKRQREVIQKIMAKILALDSVSRYRKILSAVSQNMQTDIEISTRTIPQLLSYKDALKKIKNAQLYGEDATINGGSYQLVTEKHLLKIQNDIRKALGKEQLKKLETTAILYDQFYDSEQAVLRSETSDPESLPTVTPTAEAVSGGEITPPTYVETPVVAPETVPVETPEVTPVETATPVVETGDVLVTGEVPQ